MSSTPSPNLPSSDVRHAFGSDEASDRVELEQAVADFRNGTLAR